MDKKHSWKTKVLYKIDCIFSEGVSSMILLLGVASILIILIASVIAVVFQISPQDYASISFFEAFWASLMRTLDPGSMAGDLEY
jgi:hypothetical protein